jgi:hypothetical protein
MPCCDDICIAFDSCRRFILRLQGEVQGCDIFHIAAVGDWVEWGEQTLCMHMSWFVFY